MLELEKIGCTRCGGTGYTAFYWVQNGVCFKCGGRKWNYTRRGAKAADEFNKLLPRKRADELVVGDRVRAMHLTVGGDTYNRWSTVVSIEPDPNPGHSFVNGVEMPNPNPLIVTTYNAKEAAFWKNDGRMGCHCPAHSLFEMSYSAELVQEILAGLVARRFKGVVEKEAVAA